MSKSVYTVVTQGTGASTPKTDLVLTQPSSPYSAQEVANDAAIAANTDPSPVLVTSDLVFGATGIVDSDITTGGVGDAYLFQVTTRKTDNSLVGINVLSKDKQQGFSAYNAGTTYIIGDKVDYGMNSYKSRVNANIGNQPDTHPTQWAVFNRSAQGRAIDEGITSAGAGSVGQGCQMLAQRAISIDAS